MDVCKPNRRSISLSLFFWMALAALASGGTRGDGQVLDLLWAPDGSRVAVVMSVWDKRGPATEIRILEPAGELSRQRLESQAVRLVGWTPDSAALALEWGDGALWLLSPGVGMTRRFEIPGGAVPIATDGRVAYYFSQDGGLLLADDGRDRPETVAFLPEGTRPSGSLSPDGQHLALRRSVRDLAGWSTEIWVLSGGTYRKVATLSASFVKLSWHPEQPALIASVADSARGWSARLVGLDGRKEAVQDELPSPAQWDRRGRLYVADGSGLWQLSPQHRRVARWASPPDLWAVSPAGDVVAAVLGTAEPVAFYSLR